MLWGIPLISVVIPTWNGKHHLVRCLPSLQSQTLQDFEIIVVDNGSTDGTAVFLQEKFSNVTVIALQKNHGFSAAVNKGIAAASGEFIAVLNNDTQADKHWLEQLLRAATQNPGAHAFASKILSLANPSIIDAASDGYSRSGMAWNVGRGNPDGPQFDEPRWAFGASGCAAFYRRAFLDEVGCFDEDLFAFYEDVDLALRGQLLGRQCLYVPSAVVFHQGGGTLKHLSPMHIYFCSRNAPLVLLKNMPARLLLKNLPVILWTYAKHFVRHLFWKGHTWGVLKGYGSALINFPKTLRKRKAIQKSRRITDTHLQTMLLSQEELLKKNVIARNAVTKQPGSLTCYISVILVHYRTEELLAHCLENLFAGLSQSGLSHEVFVIDNGSSAEKIAPLQKKFTQAHWIANSKNEGFAKAANQGLKQAQGKFCLLLNPDCLVSPTCIGQLVKNMETDASFGIAGGRHRFPDGRLQPTAREFPTPWNVFTDQLLLGKIFPNSRWLNGYHLGGWKHDQKREVDQLMGSCLLIRRAVLDQIGPLDERFFMYFEEVDLCLRAKQAGWKIVFFADPDCEVTHVGGASSMLDLSQRTIQRNRSLCQWYRKNYAPPWVWFVKALILKGLFLRLAIYGIAGKKDLFSTHWTALKKWHAC